MFKTPESKFNYLIDFKRNEFELTKQVNKKKF